MKIQLSHKLLTVLLATALLLPSFAVLSYPLHQAEAGPTNVNVFKISAPKFQLLLLSTGATATATGSLVVKEFTLDAIAFAIAKIAIRSMTSSIVNWINSGFEGSPSFVTDLDAFLLGVADQTIGSFIEGSDLAFLCSPFQLDVKILISTAFNLRAQPISCTLTEVVDNVEGFFNGAARLQNWRQWIALSTNPANNPYGSFLLGQARLEAKITLANNREVKKLEFGKGFFSFEKCDEVFDPGGLTPAGGTKPVKSNCRIVTPGSVIEASLVQTLGTGIRQLELADELNEIIAALIGQLLQQALTGGVSNLSARSSFGQPSFTERLINDTSADDQIVGSVKEETLGKIDVLISNEARYRGFKESSFNTILRAEENLRGLNACYLNKVAGHSLTTSEKQTAQVRAAEAAGKIVGLKTRRETLQDAVDQAQSNLDNLRAIEKTVADALTPEELETAVNALLNLEESEVLHSIVDVADAQTQRGDIEEEIAALNAQTQGKIAACNVFPPRSFPTI